MSTVRSRDGDTVPLILWLALNRNDDEAEEALYALNPGLEQYGPVLPAGVEIKLPELSAPAPAKVVNVWD
ncbi:tail protein X [Vibrio parahaemolyticus]|uniref:tail protein X n=1 Tax=Vibrio TaxID=662 RepID=UPI000985C1D9|nr:MULTISPECIES: tail protein X [unclassified Vibrio]EGR0992861.1 phage tail protein [Vibrio parahaemolyticus]OOI04701.1 phage tail protein [Vibrio sp. OULL4]MBE4178028.1 phage tail protein [Vibrio parahaemolyticus]MBE4530575.1 phage tail protein [Vibrio parahaemolyticus]MDG2840088.1 tail protein X [Vibrio parahaemolyticus]